MFILLIALKTPAQERKKLMSLNEIKSKLPAVSLTEESKNEINQKLIKEICERNVNFNLTTEDEKVLSGAGANDSLINAIRSTSPESMEVKRKLYDKYIIDYQGADIAQIKEALQVAKEYVEKFGNSDCDKAQIDYFKEVIPQLEFLIKRAQEPPRPHHPPSPRNALFRRFDEAYESKKWEEIFKLGSEILNYEPDFVDIPIILASVGYNQAVQPKGKNKFAKETVHYAELAIILLEKGITSKTKSYGAYEYKYENKEYPDGKSNSLGWMNYIIGYMKYFYLNQKEAAIPYFQKSLQYKSESNKLVHKLNLLP